MNKRRYLLILVVVVAAVVIAVLLGTLLGNHPPAIAGINALERVVPRGKCPVVCNATDRDHDELSYNWIASGGNISGTGATVNWTAPDLVGSYNISVTVTDGRRGEATRQRTIEVRANSAPTISSLAVDADWTLPSGSLQMTCTASDPDPGEQLSYEWSATGGDISGTGDVVAWHAPQEAGIYRVTVVVKDGHGTSATRTAPISVVTEQPPTIEELLVTADHCYLKTYSWGYKVGKNQEYHIRCVVANTSADVSYNWSSDDGDISGEGSMVNWTAPNPSGSTDVTVTVIVTDVVGNMAIKDVSLNVVSCSPCTFGC